LLLYSPAVETMIVVACAIKRNTAAITATTTSNVTTIAIA